MSKATDKNKADMPLEALMLECTKDKYRISYAAIRLAREIKSKENLPEPLPIVLQRSLRELLTGKATIKEVEKLPVIARVIAPMPQQQAAPSVPTITLNPAAIDEKPAKKSKEDKEDEEADAE